MNISILSIFVILGFLFTKFFSGKETGKQGRIKSFLIQPKNHIIHFHHWFIATVILIALILKGIYNDIAYGFLIGITFQGLKYKDFYKLIYKKKIIRSS